MKHLAWLLVVACFAAAACDNAADSPDGAGTGAEAGTGGAAGGAGTGGAGGVGATGGSGGTGGSGSTAQPKSCVEIACKAPAQCDDSAGDAECFCPDGYLDIQGDGSLCEDIDECSEGTDDCAEQVKTCMNTEGGFECTGTDECAKDKTNDCDAHATCTDTATAYECACDAPWVGDGKDCTCPAGFKVSDGECLAKDGGACDDDDECLHGACVDGTCCAQSCDSPGLCKTENGATCSDGATCVYPTAPNGSSCAGDGNPCTVDKCIDGACDTATAKVCNDGELCTTDTCDPADLDGDPCHFDANTVACDDGNPCTVNDACSNTFCDGELRNCSDGNGCTSDSCNSANLVGDPCEHAYNSNPCDDANACTGTVATPDQCSGGSCQAGAVVTCNDTNPCTDDMCNTTLGCQYVNNSASCSDDDACTGPGATGTDSCAGGVCVPGATKNCDDGNLCKTDTCNPDDTSGDPCVHTPNSVACDDSNSCTTSSSCSDGSCPTGTGNACGPNSTSCAPGAGDERSCTCAANYSEDETTDYCMPITNQCLLDPCDTNATCLDPTPNGSMTESCDTLCTCGSGYSGTGCTGACADINECTAGNPCGEDDMPPRATCSNTPAGSYTCNCAVGYTKVGSNCVCDLNGTWAIRITTNMTWSGISNISDGSATTYSWALRNHSYGPDGTLEVETIPCGGTTPTLCGNGGGVPAAAYGQFLTNQIWGIPSVPSELLSMNLPNALPSQAFVTSQTAVLFGIHLTDPFGTWPAANDNVGSQAAPGTNGAYWVNHDNSGDLGVEAYAVPPGGIADDNSVPDPPVDLSDSTPAACGGTLAYAWWPGLDDLFSVRRVKRWSLASRVISYLDGSLTSCDLIEGSVKGPLNGQMKSNSRVKSCTRCTSGETAGCSDTACSNTLVDFYDNQSQPPPPTITGATFRIERINVGAATTTNQACEMVRDQLCPGGLSCN